MFNSIWIIRASKPHGQMTDLLQAIVVGVMSLVFDVMINKVNLFDMYLVMLKIVFGWRQYLGLGYTPGGSAEELGNDSISCTKMAFAGREG